MKTRCLVASPVVASEQNLLHNRAEHEALVLVCYAATPLAFFFGGLAATGSKVKEWEKNKGGVQ